MSGKQIAPAPVPQQVIQKPEQSTPAEPSKQVTDAVISPKVDYATDLFNMLSLDGSNENASCEASAEDISWAGFQCMSVIHILVDLSILFLFTSCSAYLLDCC